ncbi:hypothetical protein Tco_0238654 [Tanacetum coccineum]
MYRIATSTTQNREPQLPHASRNTNPHVSTSTGVNHSTSVSRPPLKSYQVKDKVVPNNSQVKFTKKEVEDHHRISSISKKTKSVTAYNDSSNSRTLNVNVVCAECEKYMFNSNHDACVSKYLNDVNARTKKPKVVHISDSKPKRTTNKSVTTPHKKSVASDTTIQKPKSYFKELCENTNKAWKWWIPTGKLLNSCTGKVDSEPTHGLIVDIPHIHACKQTLGLSAGTSFNGQKQQRIDLNADALYNVKQENLRVWLLKMLISKKPVPKCSGLVLHQMTSNHNRSELRIHDHNNDPSSSKLVPKVVPLDSCITTRVGITIPPSYSNAEDNIHKVVRLGINPMIQPEPEDLPKDNPKLEIAVLRLGNQSMIQPRTGDLPKDNPKLEIAVLRYMGIMPTKIELTLEQSQQGVSNDVLKLGQYICCQNHKLIADIEDDIMDPVMQCTTLPSHSGFSQQKLVSFVTEIHTLSIDISFRDR